MRVDYGVGRSRGWRVDHDALCLLCVRSNFSSSLAPSLARRALARARDPSPFSPLALSRPLCPFVLSSPRLSVLPLPRPIIIAVSLSLFLRFLGSFQWPRQA